MNHSIAAELAEHIWNQIETFAGYGFNKSHSAAYAVVTFRTAYLKAHYPVEFMAALMSNEVGNQAAGKLAIYANVCREKSIQVLPPDVNHSQRAVHRRAAANACGSDSRRSKGSALGRCNCSTRTRTRKRRPIPFAHGLLHENPHVML